MRNDRTGLTPGTLPLITFDRCALETRRYKAACASVMTEVCGFGRIMDSLYEEAAKNRRTIREPLVHTPEALRLRSCLVFPAGGGCGQNHGSCWEQRLWQGVPGRIPRSRGRNGVSVVA